jgi:hypothetical protein
MKRPAVLLTAALALTAACMAPRMGPSAGDILYATARDGAQRALSVTFELSAAVADWVYERCADHPGPEDCHTREAEPGSPNSKEVTT